MFKLNPNFNLAIESAFNEFVEEYFKLAQQVISNPRLWEDWETSNPVRDIIDSQALHDSGKVIQNTPNSYTVQWQTEYVTFVYFGYALEDGRRIPSRKWAELAISENDLFSLFIMILSQRLKALS